MSGKTYLYGKNALHEALLATKRGSPLSIEKLFLTKKTAEDPKITGLIQSYKITPTIVTQAEIESFVGKTAIHQDVCALLDENTLYTPLDTVLSVAKNSSKKSLFVLLDELQDPHNVGAIIRSAVAFRASAILLPTNDQTQITGTVIKTSSGMNFAIPIVKIGNVNTTLTKLQDNGFWVYGLTGDGDTQLHEAVFDTSAVIVVGSEGFGIREKTLELCDFKLSIKTSELAESLNASNACAVVMYEWAKQQDK